MKIKDFTPETAALFIERIETLTPQSQRQWGTMSVEQMLRHLRLAVQTSLGEIDVADKSNLFYRAARPLVYSGLLPKPKGKVSAPQEFVVVEAASFNFEQAELIAALHRFVHHAQAQPAAKARHPFFGMLTMVQWQRSHALHLDHHLEQFGV